MSPEPESQETTPTTTSSVPPSARGLSKVPTRYWVAAIVAATQMAVAITAYLRPNETSARKSYDVLAVALESEAKSSAQNHDDIIAMHQYLDNQYKMRDQPTPLVVTSATPPPEKPNAPLPPPKTIVTVRPVVKVTQPPPVVGSSAPPKFRAPPYEHVTGKDDLPL